MTKYTHGQGKHLLLLADSILSNTLACDNQSISQSDHRLVELTYKTTEVSILGLNGIYVKLKLKSRPAREKKNQSAERNAYAANSPTRYGQTALHDTDKQLASDPQNTNSYSTEKK